VVEVGGGGNSVLSRWLHASARQTPVSLLLMNSFSACAEGDSHRSKANDKQEARGGGATRLFHAGVPHPPSRFPTGSSGIAGQSKQGRGTRTSADSGAQASPKGKATRPKHTNMDG
jgi:hypothetical protein